jgi:hypothetical protein
MNHINPSDFQSAPRSAIAALRRFNRPRVSDERCDLCAARLSVAHQHLIEPTRRQVVCACDACAVLFSGSGERMKYRRVPRRIENWHDFQMTDRQWQGLGVPIALAFFFHSSPAKEVITMYPSPAGATESLLPTEAWDALVLTNPCLRQLEPDVETLLVNRINGARDFYRAPIDECFKLVGLVRSNWRGLSGGTEMWKQVGGFFDDLERRAVEPSPIKPESPNPTPSDVARTTA